MANRQILWKIDKLQIFFTNLKYGFSAGNRQGRFFQNEKVVSFVAKKVFLFILFKNNNSLESPNKASHIIELTLSNHSFINLGIVSATSDKKTLRSFKLYIKRVLSNTLPPAVIFGKTEGDVIWRSFNFPIKKKGKTLKIFKSNFALRANEEGCDLEGYAKICKLSYSMYSKQNLP